MSCFRNQKQSLTPRSETPRSDQRLALVEQAFRCVKGIDLLVRPIHHRIADRVRAHILLCLLAFYVEWHLRQVWEPLLFEDEELTEDRRRRDPVAPYAVNPGCNAFLICFAIKICFFVARKTLGGPGGTSCFFRG